MSLNELKGFDLEVETITQHYGMGSRHIKNALRRTLYRLAHNVCKAQREADFAAFGGGSCHEPMDCSPLVVPEDKA